MFQAMGQRDSARQALTTADTQLAGTRSNLASTQRDLNTRKAEMKYLDVFLTGYGKVIGDASKLESCSGNATCLSDLAQLRQDVQNLQTSRAATPVPPTLSAADTQLKGALDQYLASLKLLTSAIDSGNQTQFSNAERMLYAADDSFGQAVSA